MASTPGRPSESAGMLTPWLNEDMEMPTPSTARRRSPSPVRPASSPSPKPTVQTKLKEKEPAPPPSPVKGVVKPRKLDKPAVVGVVELGKRGEVRRKPVTWRPRPKRQQSQPLLKPVAFPLSYPPKPEPDAWQDGLQGHQALPSPPGLPSPQRLPPTPTAVEWTPVRATTIELGAGDAAASSPASNFIDTPLAYGARPSMVLSQRLGKAPRGVAAGAAPSVDINELASKVTPQRGARQRPMLIKLGEADSLGQRPSVRHTGFARDVSAGGATTSRTLLRAQSALANARLNTRPRPQPESPWWRSTARSDTPASAPLSALDTPTPPPPDLDVRLVSRANTPGQSTTRSGATSDWLYASGDTQAPPRLSSSRPPSRTMLAASLPNQDLKFSGEPAASRGTTPLPLIPPTVPLLGSTGALAPPSTLVDTSDFVFGGDVPDALTLGRRKFRAPASAAARLATEPAVTGGAGSPKRLLVGRFSGNRVAREPRKVPKPERRDTAASLPFVRRAPPPRYDEHGRPITRGSTSSYVSAPLACRDTRPVEDVPEKEFKALMRQQGFTSTVSGSGPLAGTVYVSTWMRLRGVPAAVFRYAVRHKILLSLTDMLTSRLPDIHSEDAEILEVVNLGVGGIDAIRGVFKKAQTEMLDNVFESEVRLFRQAQDRTMGLLRKTLDIWRTTRESTAQKATSARVAAKRFAKQYVDTWRAKKAADSPAPHRPSVETQPKRTLSSYEFEVSPEEAMAFALAHMEEEEESEAAAASRRSSIDFSQAVPGVPDIDSKSVLGHMFLTSNLHRVPVKYPPEFFEAARLMQGRGYERDPALTCSQGLKNSAASEIRCYFNTDVLPPQTTAFHFRVCAPTHLAQSVQRCLMACCVQGVLDANLLDGLLPVSGFPSSSEAAAPRASTPPVHIPGIVAGTGTAVTTYTDEDLLRTPLPRATSTGLLDLRFSCQYGADQELPMDLNKLAHEVQEQIKESKLAADQISHVSTEVKHQYHDACRRLKKGKTALHDHVLELRAEEMKSREEASRQDMDPANLLQARKAV